jgi:hypothetical protein
MKGRRAAWLLLPLGLVLGGVALSLRQGPRQDAALQQRMAGMVAIQAAAAIPCDGLAARHPFVVLVLGQSNAANHGALPDGDHLLPAVAVAVDGRCVQVRDPLPGATGAGGSIWSHLAAGQPQGVRGRPWLFSVLAVESTTVDDWTRPDSPLRRQLIDRLAALKRQGLAVDAVFWQQGEADAMNGTSPARYGAGLSTLAELLSAGGVSAPILLARSTVCRTPPSVPLRAAVDSLVAARGRWRAGADTDTLAGAAYRPDGCHFSVAGLQAAAGLWSRALAAAGF